MIVRKTLSRLLTKDSKQKIREYVSDYFNMEYFNYKNDSIQLPYNYPSNIQSSRERLLSKEFLIKPLISIVVPTYNTDLEFLEECIYSVLSQSYENWELIIIDDCSTKKEVRKRIEYFARQDIRIIYKFLKKNLHISGATNEGFNMSNGEFITLLDHDDILWPNALYEVARAINENSKTDFIYTNEDKIIDDTNVHIDEFIKPDWDPIMIRSCNYITHLSVFRRKLLFEVGLEKTKYNGAQDWDLILRLTAKANHIKHINKTLYSWRVHDNSTAKDMNTKPYVFDAQRKVLEDDLIRRGLDLNNYNIIQNKRMLSFWSIEKKIPEPPLVSIVFINRVQALFFSNKNDYKNIEIIISNNFNKGVEVSKGEYVVLVDLETKFESRSTISKMIKSMIDESIVTVGGLTMRTTNSINNAGIDQKSKIKKLIASEININRIRNISELVQIKSFKSADAFNSCIMVRRSLIDGYSFDNSLCPSDQIQELSRHLAKKGKLNLYNPNIIFYNAKNNKIL